MSNVIPIETLYKQDQYFRFGGVVPPSILEFMIERNPYANRLTEGAIQQALLGFDVTDEDGEILDWNDELHEILDPNWKYVQLAGKLERGLSKSILHWFDDGKKLNLRAFKPTEYRTAYTETGELNKFECEEKTTDGKIISHVTEGNDLFFAYEIIMRPTTVQGQGRSFLERCLDELWGLSSLDENSVYFAIKHGSGMIYLEVSEDKLNDPATNAKITKFLKNFAPNGVYTVPKFPDTDPELQPVLKELQGQEINFIALRDLLLGAVSASTGFPREVLLGSELGLRSAETNQSAYFAILQEIQEQYRPVMRWLVKSICRATETLTQYENSDFKIQYQKRDTQDDETEFKLLLDKVTILEKLLANNISIESALKKVGLEDLEVEEPEPIPMELNQFQQFPQEPTNEIKQEVVQ